MVVPYGKKMDEAKLLVFLFPIPKTESLQFLFYENGNFVRSNKHGSPCCGNFSAVLLDYRSEFLTSLSGSYVNDGGLESIKFNTNEGSYGPFGRTEPTCSSKQFNFQLRNHRLFGGFHGTMSPFAVESIGIYVKPIVSSRNKLIGSLRVKDKKMIVVGLILLYACYLLIM